MRLIEEMDNMEVIEAVRKKDPQSIVTIYGKFFPVVYRRAYGQLQSEAQAKEIAQKVYAQFNARIDEVEIPDNLDRWVDQLIQEEIQRARKEDQPPDPKSTEKADRLINKVLIVMVLLIVVLFWLFH